MLLSMIIDRTYNFMHTLVLEYSYKLSCLTSLASGIRIKSVAHNQVIFS